MTDTFASMDELEVEFARGYRPVIDTSTSQPGSMDATSGLSTSKDGMSTDSQPSSQSEINHAGADRWQEPIDVIEQLEADASGFEAFMRKAIASVKSWDIDPVTKDQMIRAYSHLLDSTTRLPLGSPNPDGQ